MVRLYCYIGVFKCYSHFYRVNQEQSKDILPVAWRTQNYNFIHSYSICPFLTEFAESGSALWLVAGGWSRCGSGNKNDDIRANVAKTPPNVNPQH